MADILQITTPVAPKEYQMPNRHAQQSVDTATGQVFELGEQNRVVRTNERDDNQYSEQNLKDAVLVNPKSASGTGSPTAALDTVKGLLSTYTIEALKEKGDIDTLNKISAFAEEVILKPENLMRDMINQQESATIFSGKLWDALRQLLKSDSPDMQSAILDFVRAAADNESKDELLSSLSLNFKFLASELAPSTTDLESVMPELDILYMTRVQRERFFNEEDYLRLKDSYILTVDKLKTAKKDLAILHPLPRVNEISVAVDDDPRACYFKQVLNGKYMREALILKLLKEAGKIQ